MQKFYQVSPFALKPRVLYEKLQAVTPVPRTNLHCTHTQVSFQINATFLMGNYDAAMKLFRTNLNVCLSSTRSAAFYANYTHLFYFFIEIPFFLLKTIGLSKIKCLLIDPNEFWQNKKNKYFCVFFSIGLMAMNIEEHHTVRNHKWSMTYPTYNRPHRKKKPDSDNSSQQRSW